MTCKGAVVPSLLLINYTPFNWTLAGASNGGNQIPVECFYSAGRFIKIWMSISNLTPDALSRLQFVMCPDGNGAYSGASATYDISISSCQTAALDVHVGIDAGNGSELSAYHSVTGLDLLNYPLGT